MDVLLAKLLASLQLLSVALAQVPATTTPTTDNVSHEQPTAVAPLSQGRIRDLIIKYAKINGADEVTSLAIAKCESGFIPTARNPSSTAKGLFQFLTSTRVETSRRMGIATFDPFDPEAQANAGTWLLAHDGERHWTESKPCWIKEL